MAGIKKRPYPSLMAHPNNEHSAHKIIRPIPRKPVIPDQQVRQLYPGVRPPAPSTGQPSTVTFGPRPFRSNTVSREQLKQPPQPSGYHEDNSLQVTSTRGQQTPRQTLHTRGQQSSAWTPYNRGQQSSTQVLNTRGQQYSTQAPHTRGQQSSAWTPYSRGFAQSGAESGDSSMWQQANHPTPTAHPPPAAARPPAETLWQRGTTTAATYSRNSMMTNETRFAPSRQEQYMWQPTPQTHYTHTGLAHGGVPAPVNPLPAQQPYGDPATPFHYHDNHDHLGYQPDPVLHSNQPQYDYDPYGYQGNTNHITDLQQTDAQFSEESREEVKEEVKPEQKPDADKTLKVITATIEGMKHWVRYKNTAPMIFQLVAKVNSAVTTDTDLQCHRFMLADDKHSIEGIFYDIDRPMPQVVRGQLYRCVGRLTKNGDRFQCLSVRPATRAETRLHRATVTACDKHLRYWVRQLNNAKR